MLKSAWTSACVATCLVATFATATVRADLLVNPSFEDDAIINTAVLSAMVANQGTWGVEGGASRVSAEAPVFPADGDYMLKMLPGGGSQIQAFQVTDLSSYAAMIDNGNAMLQVGALFNAHASVPAAQAGVRLWFYPTPVWTGVYNGVTQTMVLDNDPSTWEEISYDAPVPVGMRWVVTDLFFENSTIAGFNGYADVAKLSIYAVPEPSSLLLLALGGAAALCYRWRRYR